MHRIAVKLVRTRRSSRDSGAELPGPYRSRFFDETEVPRSPLAEEPTEAPASVGVTALVPVSAALAPATPTAPARSAPGESPVLFGLLSPAPPTGGSASTEHVVEKLRQWNQWVHGAYAANTEVAWESDWRGWLDFCSTRGADHSRRVR